MAGAVTPAALYVSNVAPLAAAPGTSCTHPGYATIQSAINAAAVGATIHVCASINPYVEQLTITKSLSLTTNGPATVQLPASPVNSATTCDNAIGGVSQQPQDEISICGAGTVNITGLTVSAFWPAGTCYDSLYGVFVGSGSNLVSNGLKVNGAGVPIGDSAVGCQGGVAIQVGSARPTPNEKGKATLTNTTVSGYQKNGITATGTGSSMTVTTATVTGRGPVGTAENGIEVAFGAKGIISGATVSGNSCNIPPTVCGPDSLNDSAQATGVLFFGAKTGSSLSGSKLTHNDIGVYYGSAAATEPLSPEVTISNNNFKSNGDEQIQLDQGFASVVNNKLHGTGNVGIQVLQYSGQTFASASTASNDTISGQGIGVQVYSDLCTAPAYNGGGPIAGCVAGTAPGDDMPGTFNINNSNFLTTNTLAEQDNSTNFFIMGSGNI
jgi:hypothetical protein